MCTRDPLSFNEKGHVPDCICLLAVAPVLMHIIPDVQMERDIIFDLEQPVLCNRKYVVPVRTIPMLHQLTVQKAIQGRKSKRDIKGKEKGKGWLPELRADGLQNLRRLRAKAAVHINLLHLLIYL